MSIPYVSIIVPCYKVEKYLDRCVESLVNQTLHNIEIILVDDGSPDSVGVMCDKWSEKDSRIKVIHKRNGGLGFARNSGIDAAIGEYVAFVDGDDYVDKEMYSRLWKETLSGDVDCVFCGFNNQSRKGVFVPRLEVKSREYLCGSAVKDFMLDMIASGPTIPEERKYYMSVWHAIYKNSIIKNNHLAFPSEREIGSEDIPFQIDFLKTVSNMVYIPDALYYYCYNSGSLVSTYSSEKFERYIKLRDLLRSKLLDNRDALLRIDRLFIGYVRSNLTNLFISGRKDKKAIIHDIIHHTVWDEISASFSPSFLPILSRIEYRLILAKHQSLLYIYAYIIVLTKSILGKR